MLIVHWNAELAQRFPNASHRNCVQDRETLRGFGLVPYDPPRCRDLHCARCGQRADTLAHDCALPKCGASYGFSAWCVRTAGHPGLHGNTAIEWSDEDAEASKKEMFKRMKGSSY